MKFGICTSPDDGAAVAEAGFDFIELNACVNLKSEEPESSFIKELDKIRNCPVPCLAANCFVPGPMKITGPDADKMKLAEYVKVVMARAERAGIKTIVLGSSGARKIPEGFDRTAAWQQLVNFARQSAQIASSHGVTVVIEPLNSKETNVLNTVSESARLVKEVDHPRCRLLVDSHHWGRENDTVESIIEAGPLFHHIHIGTVPTRKAPSLEPYDFSAFFNALKKTGYDGTMSIEAGWGNLAKEATGALETIKSFL
jgi:sugar phosphate isomerase/epimerase